MLCRVWNAQYCDHHFGVRWRGVHSVHCIVSRMHVEITYSQPNDARQTTARQRATFGPQRCKVPSGAGYGCGCDGASQASDSGCHCDAGGGLSPGGVLGCGCGCDGVTTKNDRSALVPQRQARGQQQQQGLRTCRRA